MTDSNGLCCGGGCGGQYRALLVGVEEWLRVVQIERAL